MSKDEGMFNLVETSDHKDFQTIDIPLNVSPEIKNRDLENNIVSISSDDKKANEVEILNTINEPIIQTLVCYINTRKEIY